MENPDNIKNQKEESEEELYKQFMAPLTKENQPNLTQIQIDAINVYEKRVDISSFTLERQKQIRNYYRFSPVSVESSNASATQKGRGQWK